MKQAKKGSAKARKKAARLVGVQIYHQTYLDNKSIEDLVREALVHHINQEVDGEDLITADAELLSKIVQGAYNFKDDLVDLIQPNLKERQFANLDHILQSILLLGSYELLNHGDIDAPIIVNDYLDVGHAFYEPKEVTLLNAVLDKVSKAVRS